MPSYSIKSPVIIFNHNEYRTGVLFQKGLTNPRNELGKNGVTLHNWFGSLFYKTIKIQAPLINERGIIDEGLEFVLNRNSLIKYIGSDASSSDSDKELIKKLNDQLAGSNLNQPNEEERLRQSRAGDQLRHAGEYNQKNMNHSFFDYFKGGILSWLYQKTIGGINRIKARFFFYGTEKDLFEAGEVLAKKRFQEAYADIPAYKTHITRFNGMPVADTQFRELPKTSKNNYIKVQKRDADTHFHGQYPAYSKTDTSTGTTGKATAWVRSDRELDTVKKSLKLATKIQFGNRRLSYINAFALGPWATGLTTYELMRETGSVFAAGPDKEKILEELLRIEEYEQYQLFLAVNELFENNSISQNYKTAVIGLINNTLKSLLKNREYTLDEALGKEIEQFNSDDWNFLGIYESEIKAVVKKLNAEKTQLIIAGYPPFLKDLAAYVKEKGHDLKRFSAIGIVGGQAISEAMRDVLLKDGFNHIYSSYGASDLDINLGVETDDEIIVRKAIEKNPGLARELYGANKGLPMVFHYDPMNYHVECEDADEDKDSLIFTCTRDDRSSSRIRYNLGDKGRVYASSDVQALLAKYGIFHKPKSNLPLMFVWGRDSTVVFNGANVAFTELDRAVTDIDTNGKVLKKAFYQSHDKDGAEKLEIWLELHDDFVFDENEMADFTRDLIFKLASLNQDFCYQLESLDEGAVLPTVRFFKSNQSPISEAGGHRKQVLVFQKEDLPEEYTFSDESNCSLITLAMGRNILEEVSPIAAL